MRPGQHLTGRWSDVDDRVGVDGAVDGRLALPSAASSGGSARLQNGFVRSYALSMLGGAAARRRWPCWR